MGSSDPVEIVVHIPACYHQPYRTRPLVGPMAARIAFLRSPYPMPIGDAALATPGRLVALTGARAHITQLSILGGAVLAVLESEKPRFHRSRQVRASGEVALIEASGTTITVTGYEKDSVIFATWDAAEAVDAALGRLSEVRRVLRLPNDLPQVLAGRYYLPGYPPPQVVVSNVIPIGEREPMTTLGAYDGGAAEIPIVMAVGLDRIAVVFDHRVYNPPDIVRFQERLREELSSRLT